MLHTNRLIPSIHLLYHGAKTVLFLLEIIKQRDNGCFGLGLYHIYIVFQLYAEHPVELKELKWEECLFCPAPNLDPWNISGSLEMYCCAQCSTMQCVSQVLHSFCCWTWLTMCNVSLPTVHCKTSWVPSPIISFVNCGHWHPTSAMIVLRIIETTLERVY